MQESELPLILQLLSVLRDFSVIVSIAALFIPILT